MERSLTGPSICGHGGSKESCGYYSASAPGTEPLTGGIGLSRQRAPDPFELGRRRQAQPIHRCARPDRRGAESESNGAVKGIGDCPGMRQRARHILARLVRGEPPIRSGRASLSARQYRDSRQLLLTTRLGVQSTVVRTFEACARLKEIIMLSPDKGEALCKLRLHTIRLQLCARPSMSTAWISASVLTACCVALSRNVSYSFTAVESSVSKDSQMPFMLIGRCDGRHVCQANSNSHL